MKFPDHTVRLLSRLLSVAVQIVRGCIPGDESGPAAFPLAGPVPSVSTQSAPVGIRTPNLLIRSQMLYPLSYGRPLPNWSATRKDNTGSGREDEIGCLDRDQRDILSR